MSKLKYTLLSEKELANGHGPGCKCWSCRDVDWVRRDAVEKAARGEDPGMALEKTAKQIHSHIITGQPDSDDEHDYSYDEDDDGLEFVVDPRVPPVRGRPVGDAAGWWS